MSEKTIAAILLIALCASPAFPGAPAREDSVDARIAAAFEAIRLEHGVPAERDWGGGTVMTHAGSNTMNFAVVWMTSPTIQRSPGAAIDLRSDALRIETPDGRRSPKGDFAVLVVTNQGGPAATKACDAAAGALIRLYQAARS